MVAIITLQVIPAPSNNGKYRRSEAEEPDSTRFFLQDCVDSGFALIDRGFGAKSASTRFLLQETLVFWRPAPSGACGSLKHNPDVLCATLSNSGDASLANASVGLDHFPRTVDISTSML